MDDEHAYPTWTLAVEVWQKDGLASLGGKRFETCCGEARFTARDLLLMLADECVKPTEGARRRPTDAKPAVVELPLRPRATAPRGADALETRITL